MAFHTTRQLILTGVLVIIFAYIQTAEEATISSRSEHDSSSAAEPDSTSNDDFNERSDEQQLQKRSTDGTENNGQNPRKGIPGLPDPATIIKIAQVLQTVSEQVIPVLIEGINAPAEIVTEHLNRDFNILKKLKSRLDLFGISKQK